MNKLLWMAPNALFVGLLVVIQSQLNPVKTQSTLAARMQQSEQSWQQSVIRRNESIAQHPAGRDMPVFPAVGERMGMYPYTFWDFVTSSYTCPWDFERVGRLGDGGKWVCGMTRYVNRKDTPTILYSFGINQETSFEEEVLRRTNAELYAFDIYDFNLHFSIPERQNRTTFTPVGLGAKDEPNGEPAIMTLKSLMGINGHTYIDILKIDIEGMEFEALSKVLDDFEHEEVPVGQLMVEVHLLPKEPMGPILEWFEKLEKAGFRPVSAEPNLYALTVYSEATLPRYCEYVWINVKDNKSILLQG